MRLCIVTVVMELRGQFIKPAKLSTMATSSQSVLLYIVFGGGFFCVGGCQLCHSKKKSRARKPSKLEPRDNSTQQNPNAAPSAGDDPYALSLCAHET